MPWVPLAIAAIGAIGSAVQAKHQEKSQNKITRQALADQQSRQKYLDETFGRPLTGAGSENLNMVQNYLRSIASGNRAQTMQSMAPEINSILSQNQGAVGAQRSLFQRGGTTASQAANIPNQVQGNINNLMFAGRQQAIGSLGTLGQGQTSLGLAAMGQGAGLTNSMLQYGLDARRLQMEQGMALGQGVGGFLQLAQQLYGNNRPGSTATSPYVAPSGGYNLYQSNPYSGGSFLGGSAAPGGFDSPANKSYSTYNWLGGGST